MRGLVFLFGVLFGLVSLAIGQVSSVTQDGARRIPILHADPWVVVSLLKGVSPPYPEISTLMWFIGVPQSQNQTENWLVSSGILIVNPADNSIWYLPNKQ